MVKTSLTALLPFLPGTFDLNFDVTGLVIGLGLLVIALFLLLKFGGWLLPALAK